MRNSYRPCPYQKRREDDAGYERKNDWHDDRLRVMERREQEQDENAHRRRPRRAVPEKLTADDVLPG